MNDIATKMRPLSFKMAFFIDSHKIFQGIDADSDEGREKLGREKLTISDSCCYG